MNRCLAILAAVSVLWHTTAGCCAHHVHEQAGDAAGVVDASCGHHACESSGHSSADLPGQSECQEVTCSFALPDAPLSISGASEFGYFVSECPSNELVQGRFLARGTEDATAFLFCRSLPRHLALGVLQV